MEKKNNFRQVLLPCLLMVIAIILFSSQVQKKISTDNVVMLDDGWDVEINGAEYRNVNLETFHFEVLNRGDVLSMTTVLPQFTGGKCLTAKNQRAWMEVYIGDSEEPFFSFGKESYEKGQMIASGYMWIPLPDSASGQPVTIVYHILRNGAFSSVWTPRVGDSVNFVRDTFSEDSAEIWLCLFFALLGIILTLIFLPFSFRYKELRCFLYIGIFCVLTSGWMLTYNYSVDIITSDYMRNTYIEYGCLYLMPIPLIAFFMDIIEERWKKILFGSMAVINVLFFVIALILHMNNIVPLWDSLNIFHLIAAVELIAGVLLMLRHFRGKELENRYLLAGFLVVLVTALFDMGTYQIQRFFGVGDSLMQAWNVAYGLMVMIFCMIASSMLHLLDRIKLKNTEEVLERMVYQDFLTGLFNRAKIAEIADEIDRTGERNFAVISMDLNSLKYYNDTMGHAYGDQYLIRFGQFLFHFWEGCGVVGRMGGDEFIVILRGVRQSEVEEKISCFAKNLSLENDKDDTLKMDTAYGVAYGEENPEETVRQIYRRADERMYQMKKESKKAKKDESR